VVAAATASVAALDVYSSDTGFDGVLLQGRISAATHALGAVDMLAVAEGNNRLFRVGWISLSVRLTTRDACCCSCRAQVASNGFALCSNGLRVLASGVTISPSLVVDAGGADIMDNSMMTGGALSITNTAATGTTLDILSTLAGFTGNTIEGRFESGATGNLVNLFVGGTPAFQVRSSFRELLSFP
jgi:hypothetical protein